MYKNISKCLRMVRTLLNRKFRIQTRKMETTSKFHTLKTDVQKKLDVGTRICGFRVTEIREIEELQLLAIRLEHLQTGADYLHIARDDSNNVFCIGFRTTPMDSTGVPHILEHNVLCGSRSYPCRDPFFKMLNRSLSTFMNAMTGSDYTIYPFSTQNSVDYKNLMSIYLDAVFKPNLTELDFLQEGWRLEHSDVLDKSSPIVLKGVVFNEMKGEFADSQRLFMQRLRSGVLPSHTYGVVFGGDPLHIPSLTWKDLKQFHANHYHPSNSRIFSYGDLPLETHLSFIDSQYLSQYERIDPNTSVPLEPQWTEPRSAHIGCNADTMIPPDKQTSLAVSYLLTNITDDFENFVLTIIGELLISGPNSPFYKTLIEPELGSSLSPAAGFDGQTRTTTFTVGLQGIKSECVDEVAEAIEKTFDTVVKEGFSSERIESVLHSIELGLKHQTTTFGLGLVMNLTPLWNHNGDFVQALRMNEKTNKFRKLLEEDPSYLQKKIKHYFKNNNHKFTLTMSPEEDFEQKLAEAERTLQDEKTNSLSSEQREAIWELGRVLKSKQEEQEDISCLPTLHVADIARSVQPTSISQLEVCQNIPLQLCVQPTNGVTYFNAVLSTRSLDKDLSDLIPLFCSILTSMGAGDLDFKAFNQRSELISGGLDSSFHLASDPHNLSRYEEGIHLSSYCLQKNLPAMLALWSKVLTELRLDDLSRFATLVNMIATEKANGIAYGGHSYAMTYASSSTSYVSALSERVGGLTFLQQLKDLNDETTSDLSDVLSRLKRVAASLLNKDNIRVAINASRDHADEDVKHTEAFLQSLGGTSSGGREPLGPVPPSFAPCTRNTHHVFPFPVNFTSKSFAGIPYSHPDSGALLLVGRIMFQYLHREIREKGGAYAGGAVGSPGGPFSFYSYRDPNSTQTLQTFENAIDWALSGQFSQRDVDEAKLGVFQTIDGPVSPGGRGLRHFLHHVSDPVFGAHRLSVLEATNEDLVGACRRYLKEGPLVGTCLIGPQNEEISGNTEWTTVAH